MSPISSDDLHRIFKNLDKNKNGHVSIEDLHHLLDIIGIHTTLDDLVKCVGRKSLDYIDFLFFYEAMVKSRMKEEQEGECDNSHSDHNENENDLFKAFKVFDLNGDGYISSDELQSVLLRLGLLDKKNGGDCKEMISVFDENSDGVLDFKEFKNMMSVTSTSDTEI